MKGYLLLAFLVVVNTVFSQELITKNNIIYNQSPDWHGKIQQLNMDILYPASLKKLPLIIFAHGGGFVEGTNRYNSTVFCERLAQKNFVVANIEYRTGFESMLADYKKEMSIAVYRAEQDLISATHYLLRHAGEYQIDTSAVFWSGESAGAVTSLFAAYVGQPDWDKIAPDMKLMLGALDSLNEKIQIDGVISLWGGIYDTTLLSADEIKSIPVLLFHSETDADIPFSQSLNPQARNNLLMGSGDIARFFKSNNGCYELYYINGAGHGYGFSSDYVSNAISKFVVNAIQGNCIKSEIENKGNISLGLLDTEADTVMNVENKIIVLEPELMYQYEGKYKGHEVLITISVAGDHLMVETAGEEAHEIYPVSKDIFIEKKLHIQSTFSRDAEGNVVEHNVLLTRNNVFHYKKIK